MIQGALSAFRNGPISAWRGGPLKCAGVCVCSPPRPRSFQPMSGGGVRATQESSRFLLLVSVLWVCGQRVCVVQAKRHIHSPAGGGRGEVEQFVDKSAAARRMAPSVRLAVGLGLGSGGALRGRGRRVWAAERGPIDADGDAMVLQPIDQGVDQGLLVEQIVPLGKVEVGGDDGGGAVVALIHQTEEGVGLFGLEGQVAELVNEERTITAD